MRVAATLALVFAVAVPASASAGWGGAKGDGKVTTQKRDMGGTFEAISLRGSVDARVKVGPALSVAVTINQNLQPLVKTRLDGSTLVIDQEQSLDPSKDAFVEVTLPALRAFATSGSADARIEGSKGGDLSLSTSGSGNIQWTGEADALSVSAQGSGDVHLEGRASSLAAATSGSGDISASDLTVRDASAQTSGSGDVSLKMDGGTLQASTSGSGDVTYRGTATVQARTSGSGEVLAK